MNLREQIIEAMTDYQESIPDLLKNAYGNPAVCEDFQRELVAAARNGMSFLTIEVKFGDEPKIIREGEVLTVYVKHAWINEEPCEDMRYVLNTIGKTLKDMHLLLNRFEEEGYVKLELNSVYGDYLKMDTPPLKDVDDPF